MHAHVFASPSSAEELRKHLTELNAYPRNDVWLMLMAGSTGSPVVTWSRSFDRGNDACRPVLDRAKFLISSVDWDEFHALLFVPHRLRHRRNATSLDGKHDESLSGMTVTS